MDAPSLRLAPDAPATDGGLAPALIATPDGSNRAPDPDFETPVASSLRLVWSLLIIVPGHPRTVRLQVCRAGQ